MIYSAEQAQSIVELTTKLFSDGDVKISFAGQSAKVATNASGVSHINLPAINGPRSGEEISVINGYLDSEAAHTKFTNAPQLESLIKRTTASSGMKEEAVRAVVNLFEDIRVEKLLQREYPGTRRTLDLMREKFLGEEEERVNELLAQEQTKERDDELRNILAVPYFRAISGQAKFADYFDRLKLWDLFSDYAKFPDLERRLRTVETQQDIDRLTSDFAQYINMPHEDQPPPQNGGGDGQKGNGDQDGDGEDQSGGQSGNDDGEGEGQESAKPENDGDDGNQTAGSRAGGIGGGPIDWDNMKNMGEKITEYMSRDAAQINGDEEYLVFSREHDTIEPLECSDRYSSEIGAIETKVRTVSGAIRKDIERLVAAKNKSLYVGGKRRGRIKPSNLHRLKSGDDRVFRQKHEVRMKNTAVQLVIDCSGSMSGSKIEVASQAAWAFADCMEKINIPCEVIGFTTKYYGHFDRDAELLREMQDNNPKAAIRVEPIYMPVFKSFNEKFGPIQRKRLAAAADSSVEMAHNIDGESILIAGARLLEQTAERHIQIVFSDGQPASSGLNYPHMAKHLKDVIARHQKMGIEMCGIGIMDSSVERYYPNNVTINNVSDLPGETMRIIRDMIGK